MKYIFVYLMLIQTFLYAEHDYFRGIQLPGKKRSEVSLDKVTQQGSLIPKGYQKRVVEWWPKKGVDIVDEPQYVKLREWTINPKTDPKSSPVSDKHKWWPLNLRGKKTFKAHLIGFRGIGLGIGNPWSKGKQDYFCPAVVLRLENGRKRCFTRDSFIESDERYICKIYERQMKILRDNTFEEGIEWKTKPSKDKEYPKNSPLYKPGATQIESKHYSALIGTEDPEDKAGSLWLINDNKELASKNRKLIMRGWEDWWAYQEYAGHLMPYWEKTGDKYKYNILIGGTKKNGVEILNRGNGGSYGGMNTGDGNWWGIYHEWTHGQLCGGMISLGGGETMCDGAQIVGDPTHVNKMMFQVVKPWKNLFWGAYPGAYAWTTIGDDPNWGYALVSTLPPLMSPEEHTPMHAIARFGEKRGIFNNGIRGMGDLMGQVGARMAEFDVELQAELRAKYTMPSRVGLDMIDRDKRHYRSPLFYAPEPFGVNIIKIKPDEGADQISINFKGHFDSSTYSDWRVCIIAVDSEGRCRYSPLWNKGEMEFKIKPGDHRYWLTVTATPYALSPSNPNGADTAWTIYQGAFAYKYPYDVHFVNCKPATPHTTLEEDDGLNLVGLSWGKKRGEGVRVANIPDVSNSGTLKYLKEASGEVRENRLQDIINKFINNCEGKRHPNGGGWVSKNSKVDPTAYIAPEAMVLDGAKVLDSAVISDYAIITGKGVTIKDNSRVYGHVIISDKEGARTYSGNARIYLQNESKQDISENIPQQRGNHWPEGKGRFAHLDYRLQANYEFDIPETILLEDTYKEHSTGVFFYGAHRNDLISFDGMLQGNPGFIKFKDGGAYTFNGQNQYAEVPGTAVDLEEITLELRYLNKSKGKQILYEFGSSKDDWFKLILNYDSLELHNSKKGRLLSATSPNGWVDSRLEIDGIQITLWINDKKGASIRSTYRASEAFVPGEERLGFLAAGRDGYKPFNGLIDYFRIHNTVYSDYSKVVIPMVSTRKITPDFINRFTEAFPNHDGLKDAVEASAGSHPLSLYYKHYDNVIQNRVEALRNTPSSKINSLKKEILKIENQLNAQKEDLDYKQKRSSTYKAKADFAKKERQKYIDEMQKLFSKNKTYVELNNERIKLDQIIRSNRKIILKKLESNSEYTKLSEELKEIDDLIKSKQKGSPALKKIFIRKNSVVKATNSFISAQYIKDPKLKDSYLRLAAINKKLQDVRRNITKSAEGAIIQQKIIDSGKVNHKASTYLEDNIAKLEIKLQELELNLESELQNNAARANPAEYRALRQTFYFKKTYDRTIPKALLKELPPIPEDIEQVKKAWEYQKENWSLEVDWNGETVYEQNPESVKQPVMQMFLKKMKPWMYR